MTFKDRNVKIMKETAVVIGNVGGSVLWNFLYVGMPAGLQNFDFGYTNISLHLPPINILILYKKTSSFSQIGCFFLLKIHPIYVNWVPRLWQKPLNWLSKILKKAPQKAGSCPLKMFDCPHPTDPDFEKSKFFFLFHCTKEYWPFFGKFLKKIVSFNETLQIRILEWSKHPILSILKFENLCCYPCHTFKT